VYFCPCVRFILW
jgi:hypothetical protein